eukprot:gene3502-4778_t
MPASSPRHGRHDRGRDNEICAHVLSFALQHCGLGGSTMQIVLTVPDWEDVKEWLRRRGAAGLLAIAIELLVVAALLTLGRAQLEPKKREDKLTTFQITPDAKPAPRPASRATKVTKVKHDSGGAAPKSPTQDTPATPEPKPETPLFIPLSKDEMAAAEIGRMASASGSDAGDGRSTGRDSGAAYGPGEGPGGERLFNAEWALASLAA